ncbi:hypothetical protein NMY22_g2100 [Coprinellus aureogranulatus]|nr:hypothetical protein NMY22_g2100 [Coprinellus aureogranulatus]
MPIAAMASASSLVDSPSTPPSPQSPIGHPATPYDAFAANPRDSTTKSTSTPAYTSGRPRTVPETMAHHAVLMRTSGRNSSLASPTLLSSSPRLVKNADGIPPAVGSRPKPIALFSTSADEECAVEEILLETPAASATSLTSRPTRRILRFLLIIVSSPLIAFLVAVYANAARYYALLPAFCRLPGMEPYRSTSHCLNYPYVGLGPDKDGVSSNTPLLDGPPPTPIYWADFHGLYDLQHRIIDCMRNAFVFEGAVVLKFIDNDVSNEQSSMHQLRMEVQRRDYMNERMLRNNLYEGSRLGKKLHRLCQGSKSMAQRFVGSNRRAYEGIEENILKQPRSYLALAFLELIPRIRSDPWTWETDIEVRFQFYRSLTLLSEALYDNLLALKELPTELEGFKRDLAALRSLLMKEESATQLQPTATGATEFSIFSWSKATRPKEDVVSVDADDSREAMKMALLDRMDRDVSVALERANATLGVLRALSEDMESMRRRVASPRPDVPLFIHFRHIYVEDERLTHPTNVADANRNTSRRCLLNSKSLFTIMIMYRLHTQPGKPSAPHALQISAKVAKAWSKADWDSETAQPLSPNAKEELLVEQLLLYADDGRPVRRLLASLFFHLHSTLRRIVRRGFNVIRWIMRTIAWATAILSVACLVLFHTIRIRYYLSLPAFCRQPGMEAYLHTGHCRGFTAVPLSVYYPQVDPDTPLFDGPPPTPIYWADFHGLYELQDRMTEQLLNASTHASSTMLPPLRKALGDVKSDLSRLWHEALHDSAILTVELRILSNRQVSKGIETAFYKQPGPFLRLLGPLVPREHDFIWAWETENEVKWQFNSALSSLSKDLYHRLLQLDGLLPRLESYVQSLDTLRPLFKNASVGVEQAPLANPKQSEAVLPQNVGDSPPQSHDHRQKMDAGTLLDVIAEDTQGTLTRGRILDGGEVKAAVKAGETAAMTTPLKLRAGDEEIAVETLLLEEAKQDVTKLLPSPLPKRHIPARGRYQWRMPWPLILLLRAVLVLLVIATTCFLALLVFVHTISI